MSILDDINKELSRIEQTKEEIGDAINNLYNNSNVITEDTPFSKYAEKIRRFPNIIIEPDELLYAIVEESVPLGGKEYSLENSFYYYQGTYLDLNGLITSHIKSMRYMFAYSSFINLDCLSWDTSNVTDMGHMFYHCWNLTSLDLSIWDTSNVTSMVNMFNMCGNLTTLNLSNFNLPKLNKVYTSGMFHNCTLLNTIRLDNCNNDTIKKIIESEHFPTNAITGVTRTIYCKEENAVGLTAPTNWVFSYVN